MGEARFKLIPVIDLMAGQVVRGIGGKRDLYRPIQSRLVPGSAPLELVAALLDLHPFERLYIADLDAIQSQGGHESVVEALAARFPSLELWLDAGCSTPEALARQRRLPHTVCVLGSESQQDTALVERAGAEWILSLDQKEGRPLDPAGLFARPSLWPARVIAMALGKVGSDAGPDLQGIADLRSLAPDRQIFAAGGVRHEGDIEALISASAAGVLLASALHDGRLSSATLSRLAAVA
ncbi:phosphoribosylformimino-5-aminoimidazole carboxamide ribotide isomerase [Arboricoccus pini]|uniref:Phosphoribosylformimino-5-aminoimidazole carboxamide ribotide isomerase n=1 Tax=Arboricoccus pini TaxID=1963835 RepID=A0A212RZT5_9PROT|nr:HisA/HisF-related TIM barrel protein [Arboricoccus pini]SNB78395.1 phosphoribosylformimino-5-aminoimidazole carboxamide ribotide isomerase [Arboricoccus pini]